MTSSALTGNTSGLASATSPGLVGTSTQTFAGVKTFQDGLVFASSSLSNAQATIMGLKQYLHGTTYNGGIAPTVTCPQAGFSVSKAVFIPYQLQDLIWRCKIQMFATFTSATITSINLSVNGLASPAVQIGVGSLSGTIVAIQTYSNSGGSNVITISVPSSTTSGVYCYLDIELSSKPTWAY